MLFFASQTSSFFLLCVHQTQQNPQKSMRVQHNSCQISYRVLPEYS